MNHERRNRRHGKIRSRMVGTADRPRACVYRSIRGLEVQIIDDTKGATLVSARKIADGKENKMAIASAVGTELAESAKKKGISVIVFDRGGYRYHGRVKALAEAMRAGGLMF
ncbi:MAG: 50S ribosomal protein L18 [Candidatus Andersenbacteria bacterium RIFCSPHIGHO2_12_FULL_45_11b]|uniref:Large ribosomal subunit protein uL18 n=1 Tax=Candidatus Andersenbacteria bacterium RIFCSPHIGHO2_12_FULL_45_11b TaxID=1797282 RepID=A0A1G1X8U1_9BACT|nr:MAG: 50S ribosomal protein L18 [Candidatus Andersenbacteria bacterium RIFCSPHIGHO2_12_FULL_45_11b]